ncbi:hypothetical protein SAMN04488527_10690 [Aliiroseovarius crassostreae]|uniref:Glycerophosphoryl diester phosphodiesterase membrane domain-containing protein n=1 Tax=Aliiroseovarius crassostreae TaxID=154981 RepID=A0A0P7KDL6_9RHOB|nr:hypothetical protein [Aliiroseovarius crassostreae]KPN61590.1 hypothetical protein AKJ29_02935 [Aliiroseovarius crassostreae]SFU56918.1 hypothetical protein SAMN04488527_10690 [Aliiroseovarius crassostreae]
MSGLDILKHSWRMVWRNKADAARISVVLLLLSMVVGFAINLALVSSEEFIFSIGPVGLALMQVLQNAFTVVIGGWMAVAWHRFVLLNETPTGWLPSWHGSEVMLYSLWIILMGIGILIALIPVFAAFVPIIMQIETEAAPNMGMAFVVSVIAVVFVTFLMIAMMRLSPVLVSRALGQNLSLKQAWRATGGSSKLIFGVFFWLFLIATGIVVLVGIFVAILSAANLWVLLAGLGVPAYFFGVWLMTLLQISIMTTIYGVYVEGRELP